jgi:hypothetical protein
LNHAAPSRNGTTVLNNATNVVAPRDNNTRQAECSPVDAQEPTNDSWGRDDELQRHLHLGRSVAGDRQCASRYPQNLRACAGAGCRSFDSISRRRLDRHHVNQYLKHVADGDQAGPPVGNSRAAPAGGSVLNG